MLKHFLIWVLLFSGLGVYAQSDTISNDLFEMSFEDLLNVKVITASKFSEKAVNAPATVYVVTEQDIMNNGYYELIDVLENIPGVVPINLDFFAFGGQRGFLSNFSQTLILINGREMQNLIAAETFISHQFSTHNIKQIEVMQGPGSALYGANALVGVINIITKSEDPDFENIEYHVDLGTENTIAHSLILGKNINDFRISGSFRFFNSQMWDFSDFVVDTINFREGYPSAANLPIIEYQNKNIAQTSAINISYKKFYIGSEIYYLDYFGKGLENVSLDYMGQLDTRNFHFVYAGFDHPFSDKLSLNIELQFYHEIFYGRNYSFDQGVFDSLINSGRDANLQIQTDEIYDYFTGIYSQQSSSGSKRYVANTQLNYKLSENIQIVAGYVFNLADVLGLALSNQVQNPPFNETRSENNRMRMPFFRQMKNSVFVQVQKNMFKEKLSITLGGRFDYHEYYKSVFTFRGGLVYHPLKNTHIKLLVGQAFREPNIFEMGAQTEEINLELKPAKIMAYEIGISQSVSDYLNLRVNSFSNFVYNQIVPEGTLRFTNSDERKHSAGIESLVMADIGVFQTEISYTFTYTAEENYAGQNIENLGVYKHRFSGGGTARIAKHVFFNTRINYYNKIDAKHGNPSLNQIIEIPAFTKINTTLSFQRIVVSNVELNMSITVKNLLNSIFYMPNVRTGGPKQFLQPGRQIVGRIIFSF